MSDHSSSVQLFCDTYIPAVQDYGLIQAPKERVVSAYLSWKESTGNTYTSTALVSVGEAFLGLRPLSARRERLLFLSTSRTWTAFFDNGKNGSDPFPVMSMLADILDVTAMRICLVPQMTTIWEVYVSPVKVDNQLGYRRAISVDRTDTGKWKFYQSGEPFPFEDTRRYSTGSIPERFTSGLLDTYLRHFGTQLFDPASSIVSGASPARLLQLKK